MQKYLTNKGDHGLDELTAKLKDDLRQHIRQLVRGAFMLVANVLCRGTLEAIPGPI
jgi:hypothetical protein